MLGGVDFIHDGVKDDNMTLDVSIWKRFTNNDFAAPNGRQPTSGGAVTADSSCCAICVEHPRPHQWGPDLPFFGHPGHADPLDG